MKKIVTLALVLSMLVSAFLIVLPVSAVEANLTDGSIDSYADLEAFIVSLATKNYAGETIVLGTDITVNEGWVANDGTANAVAAPTGENAKILDTAAATQAFAGTFDGQNHTISGLYMTGKAFFPKINGAKIQNVTFDNCASGHTSGGYVGIVAGEQNGSDGNLEFTNVVVKNSKIVNNANEVHLGTLVGETTSAASVKFTDCQTINCNLYSGSQNSYVGGIVGYNKTFGEFLRCSSDTDLNAIGTGNNKYVCGGMIGYAGKKASITDCVNTGNITSSTYAGGMVGDTYFDVSFPIIINGCINHGVIKADVTPLSNGNSRDAYAGGMFGRINNAGDCCITNSVNFGKIEATNTCETGTAYAGGMAGFVDSKKDRATPAIRNCMNQGDVKSSTHAGGVMGDLRTNSVEGTVIGTNPDVVISNYVNIGNITAGSKAGGLIGKVENVYCGTIEKVITIGTVTGYNGGTSVNIGSSCAIFGTWGQNNGMNELEVIDFFYSNNGNDNVFGLWATLGSAYDNYKASYTATGKTLDFVPGTTNSESYVSNIVNPSDSSQKKNLVAYNKFFVENGYQADPSEFYAEKGAKIFKAFNLGVDWMMTDTVPVPASVLALMEGKEIVEKDVEYVGCQENAGSVLTSIRVIAGLDSLEFQSTGFELYLVPKGEEGKYADLNSDTVYTSLNVYDENGTAQAPYLASDVGYGYLSAVTVTGLDQLATGVTTMIIKPYVIASDGVTRLRGSANAIVFEKTAGGALSITDQYVM